ncbi:MAG: hypothetical protein LWX11_06865 [Firmicutes bacterium]|nr:hypothetical protein [Bacillota bacterium]
MAGFLRLCLLEQTFESLLGSFSLGNDSVFLEASSCGGFIGNGLPDGKVDLGDGFGKFLCFLNLPRFFLEFHLPLPETEHSHPPRDGHKDDGRGENSEAQNLAFPYLDVF